MARTADVVSNTPILSTWGNEIRDRTIQPFTNAAERTSQWTSPPEGSFSFLRDIDGLDYFDGTNWRPLNARRIGYVAVNTGYTAIGTTYADLAGMAIANLSFVTGNRYRFQWSWSWYKGAPDTSTNCEARLMLTSPDLILMARGVYVPAPGNVSQYSRVEWTSTVTGTRTVKMQRITAAGFANIQSTADTGSAADAAWLRVDELANVSA